MINWYKKMTIRIIQLMVSIVFLFFLEMQRIILQCNKKRKPPLVIILYYHAIKDHLKKSFVWQLDTILKWSKPIPIDLGIKLSQDKIYTAITFDDGFVSVYKHAIPELVRRNISATIFVPVGLLGKSPSWLAETFHNDKQESIISLEQLIELSNLPNIKIGSHCFNHNNLQMLNDSMANFEIRQSKTDLEKITGKSVDFLSFPFGSFKEVHVKIANEAGYQKVFTISPVRAFVKPKEFIVGRFVASPDDWKIEFWLKIRGGYLWLPKGFYIKNKIRSLIYFVLNKK